MKVSALVVTNRPQFLAWWMHQISKQTRLPDEVIIATNHDDPDLFMEALAPLEYSGIEDASVCYAPDGMPKPSLGEVRQMALDAATGDVILWFDDDDWYHPRRIEQTVGPIESGRYDAAVLPLTHWYYLKEQLYHPFPGGIGPHLPATAWRADIAKRVRFQSLATGEDHFWIHALVHPLDFSEPLIRPTRIRWVTDYSGGAFGSIILVHNKNAWQSSMEKRGFSPEELHASKPLPRYAPKDVTQEEWDETKRMLLELRRNLGCE